MLRKKTAQVTRSSRASSIMARAGKAKLDRRTFLRGSGLAVGGLAALGTVGRVTPAAAQAASQGKVEIKKRVVLITPSPDPKPPGVSSLISG